MYRAAAHAPPASVAGPRPVSGFGVQAYEGPVAVVAMAAERSLLDISGDEPVTRPVEDLIAGQVEDVFVLMHLHA